MHHHLAHATQAPQYLGALQAHTPNSIGAPIALTFIAVLLYLIFKPRRNSDGN